MLLGWRAIPQSGPPRSADGPAVSLILEQLMPLVIEAARTRMEGSLLCIASSLGNPDHNEFWPWCRLDKIFFLTARETLPFDSKRCVGFGIFLGYVISGG